MSSEPSMADCVDEVLGLVRGEHEASLAAEDAAAEVG